jgi:hypothetical protein
MKNYTTVIFVLYLLIFPVTVNILQINIFNCLNEENKMFTNSLSLSLFIFSYFLFISQCETITTYEFYLACI